jgi:hypothetical protein
MGELIKFPGTEPETTHESESYLPLVLMEEVNNLVDQRAEVVDHADGHNILFSALGLLTTAVATTPIAKVLSFPNKPLYPFRPQLERIHSRKSTLKSLI